RGAAVRRRVPAQPDHGQLHPHRRGHVRDRRCGDDPRPVGTLTSVSGTSASPNVVWHESEVPRDERWRAAAVRGATVWFTGLSGWGKSRVASAVAKLLTERGVLSYTLDGDNLRHGLNGDLGFSADDRAENVRRVGEVARLFADAGVVALVPLI